MRLIIIKVRLTLFSAYLSHETDLKSFCFYDYISLIKIKDKSENYRSYLTCFDFIDVFQLQVFTQWVWFTEDIIISVFSIILARIENTASKFWYD